MYKGKITMTITLGLMFFLLSCTMFMQFKTVKQTDITAIKNMREAELRTELTSWKNKYDEIVKKYNELEQKRNEYKTKVTSNEEATELLENELQQANMILGNTNVKGSGIIVTLTDNNKKDIESFDIVQLINELRLAGAEAISVNDERIVNISDVVDISNGFININGKRLVSPYIVKAIGNQTNLESGLTTKRYGYLDNLKGNGKTAVLERHNSIEILKYMGQMKLEYSK